MFVLFSLFLTEGIFKPKDIHEKKAGEQDFAGGD